MNRAKVVDQADVLAGLVQVELAVSLAEIIGGLSEDIERLSGEAGLLIMNAVMNGEVESLAGPKGKHDPHRRATRWTKQPGYVVLAGKKVPVIKPRVRDLKGHEVELKSYRRFQSPPRRQANAREGRMHTFPTQELPARSFMCCSARSRGGASREGHL